MLKPYIDKLSGWKFHGVARGYIALVLISHFGGIQIDGFPVGDDWLAQAFQAAGLSALRSTVKAITGV